MSTHNMAKRSKGDLNTNLKIATSFLFFLFDALNFIQRHVIRNDEATYLKGKKTPFNLVGICFCFFYRKKLR